jgi:dolichyl-phosphate beta-glucosyltransferase
MTPSIERVLLVARPSPHDVAIGLSIIIPAFNEAFRLPVALDALRHYVDKTSTEIIVVDDGSDDETAAVARRTGDWAQHLVVIEHPVNKGKGAAVRTGVAAARGDVIAFIDADNATDLAALAPMIAALGPNVGAVFGSRHATGSSVSGAPVIRGLMGRVFNHLVQAAAGTKIRDTQCGAKVFQAPAARLAFAGTAVDGFAFDIEILRRLLAMGMGVVEYPVTWHYVHGTKIRLLTPFRMLRDILRIRVSNNAGTPAHIDTTYTDVLGSLADPFWPDMPIAEGDACRIALPFDDQSGIEAILLACGLPSRPGRTSSWPNLVGGSS